MSEPRRVLLTHYDLDGVACDLLMSEMYKFEKKYKCGYAKMRNHISDGNLSGYDTAIVTDLSLTYNQYQQISKEYGMKFLYIDHHGPSVDMINDMNKSGSLCFMDKNFSGAGIIIQVFKDKIPNSFFPFVSAADAYDCWRHATHGELFQTGYSLNTLFWKYGYNDFFKRFREDISLKWTTQEQKWISDHAKDRDKALRESDRTEFGNNSLIVLDTPKGYLNDYGLQFPEYDIFYMFYFNLSGDLSLSVRTTLKDINIGAALKQVQLGSPYITTAGGHPEAGGMDFTKDTELDVMIDVVEQINDILEDNPIEDVPF